MDLDLAGDRAGSPDEGIGGAPPVIVRYPAAGRLAPMGGRTQAPETVGADEAAPDGAADVPAPLQAATMMTMARLTIHRGIPGEDI